MKKETSVYKQLSEKELLCYSITPKTVFLSPLRV